jgi:inosose dehydratase
MTTPGGDLSKLRLGTAPDSWGVWFPEDPHQVTWQQYLDELPKAGYVWTELGPSGFLPQDPARLRDELARRELQVCGGTVFAGLHRGAEALKKAIEDFGKEARLLSAVGGKYLVHLPEQYTDMHTGAATEGAQLDREQWENLVSGTNELGRVMREEFGVELVFHPHADTHVGTQDRVERFLEDTDPRYVNLCLDTGHIAYAGGNNIEIVQRFPERINYVHLKQVDPVVREHVRQANLPLSDAVKLGAMVEPPYGEPAMPPLLDALAGLGRELFCVIEQDLYPVEPDVPLPIAARTAGYFVACGLGPTRRWPYRSPNGSAA